MLIPPKHTRLMKILESFRTCGSLTMAEGMERHGTFKLSLHEIAQFYTDLVIHGCLELHGTRYCITEEAQDHFDPPPAKPLGEIVPARQINRFTPPLSRRYLVSSLGFREGSNDLRGIPSFFGILKT